VLDDYTAGNITFPNSFAEPVTFEEMEQICAHAKSVLPWMPLVARASNTLNRAMATLNGVVRQYQYLDAGWAQWRPAQDGDAVSYFALNVADGLACGLGCVGGANLLDQGAGTDPDWGCIAASNPDKCGMSPDEIVEGGLAAINNPGVHGYGLWSYIFGVDYWELSEIQDAMLAVYGQSGGRNDPALNVRGDLVAA
jgi:hypothetical protein